MHTWVRYSVAVYLGLLLAGSLVPLERWTSVRDAWSVPPPMPGLESPAVTRRWTSAGHAAPDPARPWLGHEHREAADLLARASGRSIAPAATGASFRGERLDLRPDAQADASATLAPHADAAGADADPDSGL